MYFSDPPPSPPSSDTIVTPQPQYNTNDNGINANAAEVIIDTSPPPPQSPSSSIIIFIIVISSAIIVSASIYILLRFLSRRHRQSFQSFSPTTAPHEESLSRNRHNDGNNNNMSVFDSLPVFTFGSVTGNLTAGDCAVCLSKFEAQDQLRLLPLCCHAFHAQCIDTWLSSNMTCPLCRSSVNTTDSGELSKIAFEENARINTNRNGSDNGGSFRIEIGSISRRRGGTDSGRRSYSIGSFEYIVDDGYEVSVDSTRWRDHSGMSIDKESSVGIPSAEAPPGDSLAREVSGGRSWLRDYIDRFGSFSFRSSGRFSSRQSEVVVPVEELEEHRMGEEISELFRWLSGV